MIDSVKNLDEQTFSPIEKKAYLGNIFHRSTSFKNKKLKAVMFSEISYQYLILKDSARFRKTNKKARLMALAVNDSLRYAMGLWDLGLFYYRQNMPDSAYFYYNIAQVIYANQQKIAKQTSLLINMAIIQKDIRDFTGSEVTTFKAISLLEPLQKYEELYEAYNNLGIIYNELEEHKKAIHYYKIAETYLKKAHYDKFASLWNNIGNVYTDLKQYHTAQNYFKKGLNYKQQLEETNPEIYAMLLDNLTYNQFLAGQRQGIYKLYKKALTIRQRHDIVAGIPVSKVRLAKYFAEKGDTTKAIRYAQDAQGVAKASSNPEFLLVALRVLSRIDQDSALSYANAYITLKAKLYKHQRKTRNKFARIRYETRKYIDKTEQLSSRISRLHLYIIGSSIILLLIFIVFWQRFKNRKRHLIRQREKRFEEGREREKKRISQELHDGVLAKLFGVSMSLEALNTEHDEHAARKRAERLNQLKAISKEIRMLSHELYDSALISGDFTSILQEFTQPEHCQEKHIDLHLDSAVKWPNVVDELKVNLYRIIQEAVQNIHKHAEATHAKISINKKGTSLELTIEDNGKGFTPTGLPKGIGLQNMQNRVSRLQGEIKFHTQKQSKGVKMTITLPLRMKKNNHG